MSEGTLGIGRPSRDPPSLAPAVDKPPWPTWLRVVIFAASYLACAKIGNALSFKPYNFVTFWLPSGLYVAVLLRQDIRTWRYFVLGSYASNILFDLLDGKALAVSLLFCTGNNLEALAGAWLVRRFIRPNPDLTQVRDVLGLTLFSAILSTTLSAALGAATVKLFFSPDSYWSVFRLWWSGDMLGIMVVAPMVLTWGRIRAFPPKLNGRAFIEAIILWIMVLCFSLAIFLRVTELGFFHNYALLPLLVMAALRVGPRGVAGAILILASVAVWINAHDLGDLSKYHLSSGEQVALLQPFLGVTTFTVLLLAALWREKETVSEALMSSENKYRLLSENSRDLVFRYLFKPVRGFEYISPSALHITGYTPREIHADPDLLRKILHPEDRSIFEEVMAKESGLVDDLVLRWIRKDGTICWTEHLNSAILDDQGRIIGIQGSCRDITLRKKMETERECLIEELRKALGEVKTLRGFITVCSACRKVQIEENLWQQLEVYVQERSDAQFSHGICPECARRLYPEYCE